MYINLRLIQFAYEVDEFDTKDFFRVINKAFGLPLIIIFSISIVVAIILFLTERKKEKEYEEKHK